MLAEKLSNILGGRVPIWVTFFFVGYDLYLLGLFLQALFLFIFILLVYHFSHPMSLNQSIVQATYFITCVMLF